jgi:hypothetical protein
VAQAQQLSWLSCPIRQQKIKEVLRGFSNKKATQANVEEEAPQATS